MAGGRTDAFEFLRGWYDRIVDTAVARAPGPAVFPANGNDVDILESPAQFFETLCTEIGRCQSRVSLAALDIGHGELERRLLSTIRAKLQERVALNRALARHQINHNAAAAAAAAAAAGAFQLNMLVDYNRALRSFPQKKSAEHDAGAIMPAADINQRLGQASLLWQHVFGDGLADDVANANTPYGDEAAPIIAAQIALFRHPKFDESPLLERVPGSLRETIAVQHVKAYVIDDTVRFYPRVPCLSAACLLLSARRRACWLVPCSWRAFLAADLVNCAPVCMCWRARVRAFMWVCVFVLLSVCLSGWLAGWWGSRARQVIMSGANLSLDYFTNRQDRYVVFRNVPELATYFAGLCRCVCV